MNKKAIVLISILSIIIVGLVGYIILDTTLEKKNKNKIKKQLQHQLLVKNKKYIKSGLRNMQRVQIH